jgi:hypothetical protein
LNAVIRKLVDCRRVLFDIQQRIVIGGLKDDDPLECDNHEALVVEGIGCKILTTQKTVGGVRCRHKRLSVDVELLATVSTILQEELLHRKMPTKWLKNLCNPHSYWGLQFSTTI